jgi:nicotinate-nucleotide adenylyltransferase
MRLGLFGGTFNPIHYGHLRVAEEVRQRLELERVVFVPAGTPPLKSKGLASTEQRYEMTAMAVASNRFFDVSDIECRRPRKSYYVDTAEELNTLYPDSELFHLFGIDTFLDMPGWREPERLVSLIDSVVISRPGSNFRDLAASPYLDSDVDALGRMDEGVLDRCTVGLKGGRTAILLSTLHIDISATAIRELVMRRESVKYLLPEKVESFIMTHGLYVG